MLNLKSAYFYFLAIKINIIKLFKKIYFTTDFYNKSLKTKIPKKFYFFPNPTLLSSFTSNNYFSYKISDFDHDNFWERRTTTKEELSLNTFLWLNLIDRKNSGSAIRKIINLWIKKNNKYKTTIWESSVISKRIISWILNAEIIINSSNIDFKNKFLESLIIQINHLKKNYRFEKNQNKKLEILISIYLSGLVFKEYEDNIDFSSKELEKIVSDFFDNNGFPLTKNPNELLNFSKYFVLIRSCAKDSLYPVPEYLEQIIKKNLKCLKTITTPENKIPLFNGGTDQKLDDYYKYLNNLNIKINNSTDIVGDLCILQNKKEAVFFDIGSPPKKNYANSYQSGPLSFEYYFENEKIITNCGFGQNISKKAVLISRLTSAQSTLCINDTSVVKFERNKILNKAFGTSYKDGFRVSDFNFTNNEKEIMASASHNAYIKNYGFIHKREISLNKQNNTVNGADHLIKKKSESQINYTIRFHLCPGINAIKTRGGNSILIQIKKNKSLVFSTNGQVINVEKGIFLGGNKILNNFCITVSGNLFNDDKTINWELKKNI
jgi:uncharacterized heparinase superfamily protein